MAFTIGIYDLYAYTIPGILYLYNLSLVLTLFQRQPEWAGLDQLKNSEYLVWAIGIVIAAFVLGHLMASFAHAFCFQVIYPFRRRKQDYEAKMSIESLRKIKSLFPEREIDFKENEWKMLFTALRHKDLEISRVIDKYEADSILMQNISLGLILLFVLQVTRFFTLGFDWPQLAGGFLALVFSSVAYLRAERFHDWFFQGVYQHALIYGDNLKQVVKNIRGNVPKKKKAD